MMWNWRRCKLLIAVLWVGACPLFGCGLTEEQAAQVATFAGEKTARAFAEGYAGDLDFAHTADCERAGNVEIVVEGDLLSAHMSVNASFIDCSDDTIEATGDLEFVLDAGLTTARVTVQGNLEVAGDNFAGVCPVELEANLAIISLGSSTISGQVCGYDATELAPALVLPLIESVIGEILPI